MDIRLPLSGDGNGSPTTRPLHDTSNDERSTYIPCPTTVGSDETFRRELQPGALLNARGLFTAADPDWINPSLEAKPILEEFKYNLPRTSQHM